MDDVTLDHKTIKALGTQTRVKILKLLSMRRMTQTELAHQLGLAVPSVDGHLENLESAELVRQIDDGRKWKYYELTPKGEAIVKPARNGMRILFMLGLLAIAFAFAVNQFNINEAVHFGQAAPKPIAPAASVEATASNGMPSATAAGISPATSPAVPTAMPSTVAADESPPAPPEIPPGATTPPGAIAPTATSPAQSPEARQPPAPTASLQPTAQSSTPTPRAFAPEGSVQMKVGDAIQIGGKTVRLTSISPIATSNAQFPFAYFDVLSANGTKLDYFSMSSESQGYSRNGISLNVTSVFVGGGDSSFVNIEARPD